MIVVFRGIATELVGATGALVGQMIVGSLPDATFILSTKRSELVVLNVVAFIQILGERFHPKIIEDEK